MHALRALVIANLRSFLRDRLALFWTLAFPLMRDEEYRIYEYACHEGNTAVEGVLRGARYQERQSRSPRP